VTRRRPDRVPDTARPASRGCDAAGSESEPCRAVSGLRPSPAPCSDGAWAAGAEHWHLNKPATQIGCPAAPWRRPRPRLPRRRGRTQKLAELKFTEARSRARLPVTVTVYPAGGSVRSQSRGLELGCSPGCPAVRLCSPVAAPSGGVTAAAAGSPGHGADSTMMPP
jgi:hypothetical protein